MARYRNPDGFGASRLKLASGRTVELGEEVADDELSDREREVYVDGGVLTPLDADDVPAQVGNDQAPEPPEDGGDDDASEGTPVKDVPGVGSKTEADLAELGIETAEDLAAYEGEDVPEALVTAAREHLDA